LCPASYIRTFVEKYPKNNVLKKWVIDVALGAESVFKIHQALWDMVSVDSVVQEEVQPQHFQQPSATAPHARVAPDWNW
jgi:hypothetical protein